MVWQKWWELQGGNSLWDIPERRDCLTGAFDVAHSLRVRIGRREHLSVLNVDGHAEAVGRLALARQALNMEPRKRSNNVPHLSASRSCLLVGGFRLGHAQYGRSNLVAAPAAPEHEEIGPHGYLDAGYVQPGLLMRRGAKGIDCELIAHPLHRPKDLDASKRVVTAQRRLRRVCATLFKHRLGSQKVVT